MTEIINGKKVLATPFTDEDMKALRIGDVVYLSGDLVTCRDDAHLRVLEEGEDFPVDIKDKAILHAGPIVRETGDGYEMVSVGPTTSMRMERLEYDFIKETGVKLVIGKGGMGELTTKACGEFGAVHCVFPAGNAVAAALCVEEIMSVDWLDLGMPEALWNCRVKEFGPLIVSIDTDGGNYFEIKKEEYNRRREEQTEKICSQLDFAPGR